MSAFNSNVDRLGHTCPRTYKTEAVVVGAGVVGLAIARALALRGIEVFVIEIAGGIVTDRRFPPPWTVERLPGGFKVIDANGQSLAYFYARENDHDANTAGVLTMDEARRLASNFAKLPELLGRG